MSENNSFLKGAAILGIAGVIVKILGAVYRIPLTNIIGSEGLGYYQTAYPLYSLLLTISTAGFPIAIAKLVSEKRAIKDYGNAHKIFKVALAGLFTAAIVTSLFVFFNAEKIVELLGNTNAYYALIALVPALFFVPIMSSFRGYFQGSQDMAPTAISQIAEQFFRVLSGLLLTSYLMTRGIPIAAGGASFGGSVGALVGTLTMVIIYIKGREKRVEEIKSGIVAKKYSVGKILKDLLIIAIPITIGASISPIMDNIDVALVLKRLQSIGYTEAAANELFGNKGMAQTLINLPQVFSIAISMSLVPAIADANARNQKREMGTIISSGIRMTLLIGLPAAFGLFILAKPIIGLLYYRNPMDVIVNTGNILTILSIGVIFLTLVQSLSAILQGLGRPMISAINLMVGAVVKVILTYVLTAIPSINIYGAAISTVVAFAIAATLDLICVKIYSKISISIKDVFLKPFLSALGMAVIARLAFVFANNLIGEKLATVTAILIGGIVYVVLLFLTGSITSEDLKLLPKGDKIAEKVEKWKMIK